jgi:hypothetical protein
MSHLVSIKAELTDLDAIKAACKDLGLTFKQGQTSYAWWGYSVGDYPLPAGFTKAMLGKCEHAIGVPGTTWEIGLAKNPNGKGWVPLFDFYGPQGQPILDAIGGQSGGKFIQAYGVNKQLAHAKKLGLHATKQIQKNGSIVLRVSGGAL